MLFFKKWITEVIARPVEVFVGLCVFIVPVFGASVHSVASTILGLLFIVSLFYIRRWKAAWEKLSKYEHYILMAFMFYTLTGIVSYFNVADDYEFVKQMGRYLRFTLIVPVYLLIAKCDLTVRNYFIAGICVSGPVFLAIALVSIENMPHAFGDRQIGASGQYYQIIFGNMAMLNGLIMAAYVLSEKTSSIMRALIAVSIVCAMYAAFLSVTRSGWIAFVVCVPMFFYFQAKKGAIHVKTIVLLLVIFSVAAALFPYKEVVVDRVERAVTNVELFMSGEKHKSSSGDRLAWWHVAINVWKKHPVIGTGLGDFDEDFQLSKESGLYPKVPVHSNPHSVYFHSLATTGTIGFIVMIFALFVFPFRLFLEKMREGNEVVGLSGMVFVISFAIFGLTESWTLRAPFMSMYLAYFVALMSSVPRSEISQVDGQKTVKNQSAIDDKTLPT